MRVGNANEQRALLQSVENARNDVACCCKGTGALLDDPLWQQSGAQTVEEYAQWATNLCGMACLKMILATRGETYPTLELPAPAPSTAAMSSMKTELP
jgi:hypothetical protein